MGSIDLLFENFIDTLQDKFPATTYTMLRTSTKIKKPDILQSCGNCGLIIDVVNCPLVAQNQEGMCYGCSRLARYMHK